MSRSPRHTFQRRTTCSVIALGMAMLTACDQSSPPTSRVQQVRSRDAMYARATEIARADVERFIQALNNPQFSHSGFMFRAPLTTEIGTTEDVWISAVVFSDGVFTGILDDKPPSVTSHEVGDTITASRQEITDWMYSDDDTLVGGWTLRVDIDFMQPGERRLMMDHFNLTPGDLTIPPPDAPNAPIAPPIE